MKKGELITQSQAQDLALQVAKNGAGFVSPNPLVGCVIVDKDHRFLASGFHHQLGGDHAEVDALKKLSAAELSGATVYVTLEPCAHVGRTPSCAHRLAGEPIKKVVAALTDPNPLVAGQGFEILKSLGIAVEIESAFGAAAKRVSEQFIWHIENKIPFVSLKVAASLDGQMALKNGQSQWISGELSRLEARRLRGHYDATMIGAGTLLKDDPFLDFRDTEFEGKKINRVVIWDPKNRTSDFLPGSRLLTKVPRENIIVLNSPNLEKKDFEFLYSRGIHSLFVEGGSYLLSELVRKRFYQKLYYFLAPNLLGNGLGWTAHFSLSSMAEKRELSIHDFRKVGEDLLLTAYPIH